MSRYIEPVYVSASTGPAGAAAGPSLPPHPLASEGLVASLSLPPPRPAASSGGPSTAAAAATPQSPSRIFPVSFVTPAAATAKRGRVFNPTHNVTLAHSDLDAKPPVHVYRGDQVEYVIGTQLHKTLKGPYYMMVRKQTGLKLWVPVDHDGCVELSEAEAEAAGSEGKLKLMDGVRLQMPSPQPTLPGPPSNSIVSFGCR